MEHIKNIALSPVKTPQLFIFMVKSYSHLIFILESSQISNIFIVAYMLFPIIDIYEFISGWIYGWNYG